MPALKSTLASLALSIVFFVGTGFAQSSLGDIQEDPSVAVPSRQRSSTRAGSSLQTGGEMSGATAMNTRLQIEHAVNDSLRKTTDSLRSVITDLKQKQFSTEGYTARAQWIYWGILAWLLLVIFYFIWAIHRYAVNLGLSNRDWKIRYPEVYTHTERGAKRYRKIRNNMILGSASRSGQSNGSDMSSPSAQDEIASGGNGATATGSRDHLIPEPTTNPYESDSFGLPPGTIRGTLALTSLVIFLLIEAANIYSPINLELRFDQLITAFQMVLAFYFGSRAIEALKAKQDKKQAPAETPTESPEEPKSSASAAKNFQSPETPRPQPPTIPVPNETPAMASSLSIMRVSNIIGSNGSPGNGASSETGAGMKRLPLVYRVLCLTSSFETSLKPPACFSVLTGNFDGQGLSFGALQWNIGQGSLQPLWQKLHEQCDSVLRDALGGEFHSDLVSMLQANREEQMRWALSIQYSTKGRNGLIWHITDDWKKALEALGQKNEMKTLQVRAAQTRFEIALANCRHYDLQTERAVALMFDINVQNGTVDRGGAGDRIMDDYKTKISPALSEAQQDIARMEIIVNRRCEVIDTRWREDVRNRKLTIVRGSGRVHGRDYNIEEEYGISLNAVNELVGVNA